MSSRYFTYVSKGVFGEPIKSTIDFKKVAAIISERDIIKVIFNSGTVIDINFKDNLNLNHSLIDAYNEFQENYYLTEEEMNMEMDRAMQDLKVLNSKYNKEVEKQIQEYFNTDFITKLKSYFRKLFKGE